MHGCCRVQAINPPKEPFRLHRNDKSLHYLGKVDNANIGLDLMLFDDRLSVTFDAYQRTTKDMIGPAEAIPAVSGIVPDDRAKINNATLRNRGWELSVNWQDKLKCGFSYGIGFNLFDYKAVVTKYNNPEGIIIIIIPVWRVIKDIMRVWISARYGDSWPTTFS